MNGNNYLEIDIDLKNQESIMEIDIDFMEGGADTKHKTYEGSYEVIPDVGEQVLETKDKLMSDNVTIKEIPTYEVSNVFGTTMIIGGKL